MSLRRLLAGFGVMAGFTLVSQLIGFAALAVAARRLGPENLGAANFALNLALYFAVPANFGLALLGMRDIAREPDRAREIVGEVTTLRALLAVPCFLALVLLAPVLAADPTSEKVLPFAAATLLLNSFEGEWVMQGCQRAPIVGVARFLGQLGYGILLVTLLTGGPQGALQFTWFTLLGVLITVAVTQTVTIRTVGLPKLAATTRSLLHRLRASAPLGVVVATVLVYFTVDSLMLGYLVGPAAVGLYAVAYKIPLALHGMVDLWSSMLYPHVAQSIDGHRERLRQQVSLMATVGVSLAVTLGVGATLLGPELLPRLFGAAYAPAAPAFVLLTWALALYLISVHPSSVLAAGGDERNYAVAVALGAALNVSLNLYAIPRFGTTGAAAATVAAEAMVLLCVIHRYRRIVGNIELDLGRISRSLVATGVMAFIVVLVPDGVDVLVRVFLAGAVYIGIAIAVGAVQLRELRDLVAGRVEDRHALSAERYVA